MEDKNSSKRWISKNLTLKVTNTDTGRVDFHNGVSRSEVSWISSNPNLEVEVTGMKFNRHHNRNED